MSSLAEEAPSSTAELLKQLCAPERPVVNCQHVMIVVAHPDDETIAIGGQLNRMTGVRLLHLTDGAPMNMEDALACGFARREDYADARKRELVAAMALAGLGEDALISLDVPDQQLAFRMAETALRLVEVLGEGGVRTVFTHAYEGGHPDHDATAFVVRAACHLLSRKGVPAPEVIEFPLYHARDGQIIVQEFAPGEERGSACEIVLDEATLELKRRMLAEYVTQRRTLGGIEGRVERFQPAPRRNFCKLPNGGELCYGQFDWGLRPAQWPLLALNGSRELDLPQWL